MADYIPRSTLDPQMKEEKEQPVKREKLTAVVSEQVKPKQKTKWDKFKEAFVAEDGQSVSDYLLFDVLVPAIKKTIKDMIDNGTDMILYGGSSGRSRDLPANRVSYRSYYDERTTNRSLYNNSRPKTTYGYDEIVFMSRGDAEAVKYRMEEIINQYQIVRVADYLELSGRSVSYTDNNYGWTSLDSVRIIRDRSGGYYLDLPRPMPLD